MEKRLIVKIRIFVISTLSLALLIGFQNCGKAGSLLTAPTPTSTSGDAVSQSVAGNSTNPEPDPGPDPIADKPPDGFAGSAPIMPPEDERPPIEIAAVVPKCFVLEFEGPSKEDNKLFLYRARLVSEEGLNFEVRTAELWAGKNNAVHIAASKIDNENFIIKFKVPKKQNGIHLAGGWFVGPDFNVLISQCSSRPY